MVLFESTRYRFAPFTVTVTGTECVLVPASSFVVIWSVSLVTPASVVPSTGAATSTTMLPLVPGAMLAGTETTLKDLRLLTAALITSGAVPLFAMAMFCWPDAAPPHVTVIDGPVVGTPAIGPVPVAVSATAAGGVPHCTTLVPTVTDPFAPPSAVGENVALPLA